MDDLSALPLAAPSVGVRRLSASFLGSVLGEAFRYGIASAAALALDFSLLWFCVHVLTLSLWLAGAIGYLTGLALIYVLSVRWVFRYRRVRDRRREFMIFALLGCVGLVMNSVTLIVATGLGATLAVAKFASAAIGFSSNFAIRKLVLFSTKRA